MLFEGDIVTGTIDNFYGITRRGAICKVINIDYDSGSSVVEVVGFDDDLIEDGYGIHFIHPDAQRERYIGKRLPADINRFERYHGACEPEMHITDELINFVDSM